MDVHKGDCVCGADSVACGCSSLDAMADDLSGLRSIGYTPLDGCSSENTGAAALLMFYALSVSGDLPVPLPHAREMRRVLSGMSFVEVFIQAYEAGSVPGLSLRPIQSGGRRRHSHDDDDDDEHARGPAWCGACGKNTHTQRFCGMDPYTGVPEHLPSLPPDWTPATAVEPKPSLETPVKRRRRQTDKP